MQAGNAGTYRKEWKCVGTYFAKSDYSWIVKKNDQERWHGTPKRIPGFQVCMGNIIHSGEVIDYYTYNYGGIGVRRKIIIMTVRLCFIYH